MKYPQAREKNLEEIAFQMVGKLTHIGSAGQKVCTPSHLTGFCADVSSRSTSIAWFFTIKSAEQKKTAGHNRGTGRRKDWPCELLPGKVCFPGDGTVYGRMPCWSSRGDADRRTATSETNYAPTRKDGRDGMRQYAEQRSSKPLIFPTPRKIPWMWILAQLFIAPWLWQKIQREKEEKRHSASFPHLAMGRIWVLPSCAFCQTTQNTSGQKPGELLL